MASVDPWTQIRPGYLNAWFSDAYSRDNETLTRAVHKALSDNSPPADSTLSSYLSAAAFVQPEMTPTPTASGISGSDPESTPKRSRNAIPGASGKVSKRKSRASNRSQTTFITADAANFRQMVQQVTGVKFVGASQQLHLAPVLKPEPQRACSRVQTGGAEAAAGCLPTLDSSAWLLDQHQQQLQEAGAAGTLILNPHAAAANALVNLDALANFPTLESWKVM